MEKHKLLKRSLENHNIIVHTHTKLIYLMHPPNRIIHFLRHSEMKGKTNYFLEDEKQLMGGKFLVLKRNLFVLNMFVDLAGEGINQDKKFKILVIMGINVGKLSQGKRGK